MCHKQNMLGWHYDVVIHADMSSLQMFLWERFEALTPKPVEFSAIVLGEVVC